MKSKTAALSTADVLALPAAVDLVTAGRALGIARTTTYDLAKNDDFPVPVLRFGNQYRVRRADLLDLLGIKDASAAAARPETEAHPTEYSWAAELYDPLADEWAPGTRYTDRDRAVKHLEHANKIGPAWKDGTPVQRRLVRSTTTHTVEQPAAARPDNTRGA